MITNPAGRSFPANSGDAARAATPQTVNPLLLPRRLRPGRQALPIGDELLPQFLGFEVLDGYLAIGRKRGALAVLMW